MGDEGGGVDGDGATVVGDVIQVSEEHIAMLEDIRMPKKAARRGRDAARSGLIRPMRSLSLFLFPRP